MKATIIRYLAKILSVIKQDGFFAGGKIIAQMLIILLKFPKSGDILFISSGAVGDSWRYRVKNVAQELKLHGFSSSIVVQENVWMNFYADRFKIFIFHRVNSSLKITKLIQEIKKQKKEIIFETDDLLFDLKYIQDQDFYKNSNESMRKFYQSGVGFELINDSYVKTCTTTTNYLADKLREHKKEVFIVPNKLSNNDIKIAESIQNSKFLPQAYPRDKIQNSIRIGYFSGTLSHNKDFATITDALMQIMEKYENIELFLVGPLDIESKLNKFENRIKQFPYAPREKHFANIASVDINIAPLEIGNPFCESKSELKFFEAGIVSVPTVASATQPFVEAIEDGVDGFVANGTEQWALKLEKLILDENLRKSIGEKAREKAMEKYTTQNASNDEYYEYLKSKIKFL